MREPRTLPDGVPTLPVPVTSIITENCYRRLCKLRKKRAFHSSHLHFLQTCLRNNYHSHNWRQRAWSHSVEWIEPHTTLPPNEGQYYHTTITTYTEDIECTYWLHWEPSYFNTFNHSTSRWACWEKTMKIEHSFSFHCITDEKDVWESTQPSLCCCSAKLALVRGVKNRG